MVQPGKFKAGRIDAGLPLREFLRKRMRLVHGAVLDLIRSGCVFCNGKQTQNPQFTVLSGSVVTIRSRKKLPSGQKHVDSKFSLKANPKIGLIYADSDIAIINKPSGLTTVRHKGEKGVSSRDKKFMPPSLQDLLPGFLASLKKGKVNYVRAVHRLDKDTTGLIVFALNPEAERSLGIQMRQKKFQRVYLALLRGSLPDQELRTFFIPDRGDGRRGSAKSGQKGELAVTKVRTLEIFSQFSMVQCELDTGRTHQVRVHMGEQGAPICGEKIYDRPLNGRPFPDDSGFNRVALHAASLGLTHPRTGKNMVWQCPLPIDMAEFIERIKKIPPVNAGGLDS